MYLSDDQLAALAAVDKSPDRRDVDRFTRRAIVKDFIPEQLCQNDIPTILAKLAIARRAALLPGDGQSKNYRGTYFVDLGVTKTIPYPEGHSP